MAKNQRSAISGVLVTDKRTGERQVFRTAEDAARATGVSPFIIRHACKEESHHSHRQDSFEAQHALHNGVIVTRQRCKYCPYDFTDAKLKVVVAYSIEDSRNTVAFCSAKECIEYLGISTNTYYMRRAEVLANMEKAGASADSPKYYFFSDSVRGKDGRKWYLRFFDDANGLGVIDPFVLPLQPKPDPLPSDVVDEYNEKNNIDGDMQQYFGEHPDDIALHSALSDVRESFTPEEIRSISNDDSLGVDFFAEQEDVSVNDTDVVEEPKVITVFDNFDGVVDDVSKSVTSDNSDSEVDSEEDDW